MIRESLKFLGKGIAFVAAVATFVTSLIVYPFILVLFLGYSLHEIWADFFVLIKEELQKTLMAAFINRTFGIAASLLQENSAPYETAKVIKSFLQNVGMSIVLPFIALYKAISLTLSFAIKNADEVYFSISRLMNFDGDYPSTSPSDFRLPITLENINMLYQEPQQPTMLNENRLQSSSYIEPNTPQSKQPKNHAYHLKISN